MISQKLGDRVAIGMFDSLDLPMPHHLLQTGNYSCRTAILHEVLGDEELVQEKMAARNRQ